VFLSRLRVNVGSDPNRPNPGRQWLRNLYHVHQRLCMAFPSAAQKDGDGEFLKPFHPDGFAQVHGPRTAEQAFLFRIDPQPDGNPAILVQSALEPDWDYAFSNAGFLLAAPPGVKEFDPPFSKGQSLRFRLVANPTRKIDTRTGPDGKRRNGRRVPVKYEKLPEWLGRQGTRGGFELAEGPCVCLPGYVYMSKSREGGSQRLFSVRFDGLLRVTDADAFRQTLIRGVGPAKAFGFGLLSVAPAQP
jgi:CRISPR system Cascade subunit CasE